MTEEELLLKTLSGDLPKVKGTLAGWWIPSSALFCKIESDLPTIFAARYFRAGDDYYILTLSFNSKPPRLYKLGKPRNRLQINNLRRNCNPYQPEVE